MTNMENRILMPDTDEARAHFREILKAYPYLKSVLEDAYMEGHEDGYLRGNEQADWLRSVTLEDIEETS
tara:strand:+ start:22 stop:228 length:207 start_codon:yes stop_codon:yes gene_type:complete